MSGWFITPFFLLSIIVQGRGMISTYIVEIEKPEQVLNIYNDYVNVNNLITASVEYATLPRIGLTFGTFPNSERRLKSMNP